jgi:putative two-component system response regulator
MERPTRSTLALLVGTAAITAWAMDAFRRDRRLRQTHRILVDLLLNALTADDAATARHSRRVADLSFALASACRLPRAELTTVRVAALLHDLGKIDDRFSFAVHSDGPLSANQRDQMEQHPDEGARILAPLAELHPGIERIVSSHHERWDGEGYPDCLSGEDIPLGARIIALADAYDAMTQPRQYSDAMPLEEAFAKIQQEAGRQFDPALVELLGTPCIRDQWLQTATEGRQAEAARAVSGDSAASSDRVAAG